MKIGIYGGAFNPIHYGHLRTALEVFELFSLDKIVFIPAGKTPFEKPALEKAIHRYEMVKRAVRGNKYFIVSDIELKSRGKSFTVDTIKELRARFTDCEFYFILGIDAYLDLPYWKQPERLMKITNFVVISRPGYSFRELSGSPYLSGIKIKTLKELDDGKRTIMTHDTCDNQKIFLCHVTGINISASYIRNIIRAGRDIKYLLPDSVKSYIISHKLYKN